MLGQSDASDLIWSDAVRDKLTHRRMSNQRAFLIDSINRFLPRECAPEWVGGGPCRRLPVRLLILSYRRKKKLFIPEVFRPTRPCETLCTYRPLVEKKFLAFL